MLVTTTVAALLLSAIIPTGTAEFASPPSGVTVDVVTVNGSGCPAGTASVAPSSDGRSFRVSFSEFLAQSGPAAKPTDFRKNCQLSLRIDNADGMSYGISRITYRGFGHLAAGAQGLQRATYYFAGQSSTTMRSHSFSGPFSDDWETSDSSANGDITYSPCGENRNLNINSELRVNRGTSDARETNFLAMDSAAGRVSATYEFDWKSC
ncbi:DUF4360 domain-containing protein [Umezawaea endophytica]|uniref:DUF4360 domain-containing protein n=1 Tax=Umezawaea endophytica TaxID=1654476 RepID=A0A9X2VV75_9PSEU|nr:DUF4360 domain-containing protein [Umezawaea endophytica]MCS7483438.1 DUF4360 domain-containing protein [Umezawaea endophytica]